MTPFNKDKRYLNCPECGRRRYCADTYAHGYTFRLCSKGHENKFKTPIPTQLINLEIERIIPKLKTLFDRDDAFFKQLRRK